MVLTSIAEPFEVYGWHVLYLGSLSLKVWLSSSPELSSAELGLLWLCEQEVFEVESTTQFHPVRSFRIHKADFEHNAYGKGRSCSGAGLALSLAAARASTGAAFSGLHVHFTLGYPESKSLASKHRKMEKSGRSKHPWFGFVTSPRVLRNGNLIKNDSIAYPLDMPGSSRFSPKLSWDSTTVLHTIYESKLLTNIGEKLHCPVSYCLFAGWVWIPALFPWVWISPTFKGKYEWFQLLYQESCNKIVTQLGKILQFFPGDFCGFDTNVPTLTHWPWCRLEENQVDSFSNSYSTWGLPYRTRFEVNSVKNNPYFLASTLLLITGFES